MDDRIRWAMDSPEEVVLLIRYRTANRGSIRFISPCHVDKSRVVAFDLSRGDYRSFHFTKMQIISLVWSWSVSMPMPIIEFAVG